jgi:hypothetical protein
VTEDDEARRLRNEFDAAIGPTPPAPDRLSSLTSRYAAWRRRRAIAAGAGGAAAVAVIVAVGLAVAVGPGRSGGDNEVASPTVPPTAIGTAPSTPGVPTTPPPSSDAAPTTASAPAIGPSTSRTTNTPVPNGPSAANTRQSSAPTLQGTVVNEAGAPLAGIFVTGLDGVTQTDANGQFTAPTKAGHHGGCLLFSSQPMSQLTASPPVAGDYAWQDWQSANCTNDVIANIHIVMHPGADVFGTVRDTKGAPVAGVPVFATLLEGGAPAFLTSSCCGLSFAAGTDSQGNYRIYGLTAAQVKVAVRNPASYGTSSGLGMPATPGSGQPTNLTDYGEGCDSIFPSPGCPNAPPPSPSG